MTKEFVLVLNEAPSSLNAGGAGSRRHWAVAYREKRYWSDLYRTLLLVHGVPKGMTFCHVDATIRWRIRARRDVTNYVAPIVKPFADVLAPPLRSDAPHWLPDDTDEFFSFGTLRFEYPKPFPVRDPRVKAQLELQLRAEYEDQLEVHAPTVPGARVGR